MVPEKWNERRKGRTISLLRMLASPTMSLRVNQASARKLEWGSGKSQHVTHMESVSCNCIHWNPLTFHKQGWFSHFVSYGLEIIDCSSVSNTPKPWFPVARKLEWGPNYLLREMTKYQIREWLKNNLTSVLLNLVQMTWSFKCPTWDTLIARLAFRGGPAGMTRTHLTVQTLASLVPYAKRVSDE